MTYSAKRDDAFIEEFIEHYGVENIPDPYQYPKRFEFLVKSFEYYKHMQEIKRSTT
jgi:hypothetical protein